MKFYVSLLLAVFTSTLFASRTIPLYVGKNSGEATLTFSFFVEIESRLPPTREVALEKIEDQVLHLFGTMGAANYAAAPKGDHEITKVGEPVEHSKNVYRVEYRYKGTVVVDFDAGDEYEVLLPFNPDTIYDAGGTFHGYNPCTDRNYNGEGDFWYFWNPHNPRCKLEEGKDYARVRGTLKRIANTFSTYPEYEKMPRTIEGRETILISFFVGMDHPADAQANPLRSKDLNAENYRKIRKSLLGLDFRVGTPWSKKDLKAFVGQDLQGRFYVEEFTKETEKGLMKIRMFFGVTGIDESSDVFHWLYRDALKNSSVIIYNGHSGLGGHLDLESIEESQDFTIDLSNEYQIYYFNSCSSYPYYNTQYFKRKITPSDKRGTKTLDILTNGLATAFFIDHDTDVALVKAIHKWATKGERTTYQTLAKSIDDDNLFGVNGDEDNPIGLPENEIELP